MIKIKTVKIKGFKCIKKSKIELSPSCNLLLGHNAQGKSAFLEAITYCLTDSVLSQQKKDFIEAINNQCNTASVSMTITGQAGASLFTIKRTLASTNRSGPSPVQVGTQLGVDPTILSACLNSNYFNLAPADQKKLLIKVLGLLPTKADALREFKDRGYADSPQEESWNEEIIEAIDTWGDWDAGYKKTYGLRREAGQEIKTLKSDQPKLIDQVSMGDKQVSMTAIMATHKKEPLEKQEEKHKVNLKKLYEKLGDIKALSESEKKSLEKQLEEFRAEKAEIAKAVKWTKDDTTEATRLKKAKAEFDAKVKEDVATLESLTEATEDLLAENKEKWKSDLKCPIPDKSGHAMCPAIEPNWSGQQKEIDELQIRIKKVEERKFSDQEKWDDLSEKATKCKDNKVRDELLAKDIEELTQKLENAKPEMAERKEKLEESIADIEKKVEHLKLAQSTITWNLATQETLNTTQIKIDGAEARRGHYDELCKVLAPDGIPREMVAEKLVALNARLKEHAEMIGVEIVFNENLELIQVGGKQLWTMGGAETSRIRMAVAEAISNCTGVGLLLLDELNINVASDSARVRTWLTKIGQTTQIIAAAATNAQEPPIVPKNVPVQMFWVEGGEIKKL